MSKDHALDEVLELYTLGRLPEDQLEPLEEHLLVCPACCNRLEATEQYVQATRIAAAKLESRSSGGLWRRWGSLIAGSVRKPAWVGALAVIVIGIFWMPRFRTPVAGLEDLPLTVTRGNASMATASANHGLRLQIDLAEIPRREFYRVEVVDSSGARIWEATASPVDTRLTVAVPKALAAGRYWVRLYDNDGLLREFGIDTH